MKRSLYPGSESFIGYPARCVLAVACFVVLLLTAYRHPVVFEPFHLLEDGTARMGSIGLHLIGEEVDRSGTVLSHPSGFSVRISYQCTGLAYALLMMSGWLALPGKLETKLLFLPAAVTFILGVNFLRLVAIFLVGVYQPEVFDFFHRVVFEALMLLAVVTTWGAWILLVAEPSADLHPKVSARPAS